MSVKRVRMQRMRIRTRIVSKNDDNDEAMHYCKANGSDHQKVIIHE